MQAISACLLLLVCGTAIGSASECLPNPNALGTSRVIAVDPAEYPRVGSFQYRETLPLNDHEVVLTFDDGPLPPYTTRILDTLAANCVKATFFVVGRMARSSPGLVRRAYDEGHTIGSHTESHPLMGSLSLPRAERQIQQGIASVRKALGDAAAPAPFFRFPGLQHPGAVEKYLQSERIMVWSVDTFPGDWQRISPGQVVERSLARLARTRKGILLLHDIHARTAAALPSLLNRLKSAGYHVVHVVPAGSDQQDQSTKLKAP